jgi:hypothetical protein
MLLYVKASASRIQSITVDMGPKSDSPTLLPVGTVSEAAEKMRAPQTEVANASIACHEFLAGRDILIDIARRNVDPWAEAACVEDFGKALLKVARGSLRGEAAVCHVRWIYETARNSEVCATELKSALCSLSTEEKITAISSLATLGAWFQSLGYGEGTGWGSVRSNLDEALRELALQEQQPIVRMVIMGVQASLRETKYWNAPTLAVLASTGAVPVTPTTEEFLDGTKLNRTFIPSTGIVTPHTWQRASADTLSLCNAVTLRPLGYARLPENSDLKESPVSLGEAQALLQSIPGPDTALRKKAVWLFRLHENIVRPLALSSSARESPESQPLLELLKDKLHAILPSVSLPLIAKACQAVEQYRFDASRVLEDQRKSCLVGYAKVLAVFDDRLSRLLTHQESIPAELDSLITHYRTEREPVRKVVLATEIAEAFLKAGMSRVSDTALEKHLSELADFLESLELQDNDSESEADIYITEKHGSYPRRCVRSFAKQIDFTKDRDTIVSALSGLIDSYGKDVTRLKVHSYHDVTADRKLFPFDVETDNDSLASMLYTLDQREVRVAIQRELGLNLAELTRLEQVHLFRFLRDADQDIFDRVKSALRKHPQSAVLIIRSVVGYAEGVEPVHALLSLAEQMPSHYLTPTLNAFLRITQAAQSAKSTLEDVDSDLADNQALLTKITQATMGRANQLLSDWSRLAESKESRGPEAQEKFLRFAQAIEGSSVVFAAVFKEALRDSELSAIKGLSLTVVSADELNDQDRTDLRTLSEANTAKLYPTNFRRLVDSAFDRALSEPDSRFYLLRINGKIEGFARFVDQKPGLKYLGSFNLSPTLEGFKLGGKFLETMLEQEGGDSKIALLVTDDNPFKEAYFKYGFRTAQRLENFDVGQPQESPTGVTVLEMERFPGGLNE